MKKPTKLKVPEYLRSVIDQCSYEIAEEIIGQLRTLKFSITLFGWGLASIGLDGEQFGETLPDWRKDFFAELENEIADGCVKEDPKSYAKTLIVLKECVAILEAELKGGK